VANHVVTLLVPALYRLYVSKRTGSSAILKNRSWHLAKIVRSKSRVWARKKWSRVERPCRIDSKIDGE
jgi:hypothetical protein